MMNIHITRSKSGQYINKQTKGGKQVLEVYKKGPDTVNIWSTKVQIK